MIAIRATRDAETSKISLARHSSQDSAANSSTVAHFVPRWPTNPYHAEISKCLAKHGVRVEDEDSLKRILKSSRVSGKFPEVIHVHAVARFSLSPARALRFFMFWVRLFGLRRLGIAFVWTIHDSSHHEALHPRVDLAFSRILYKRADGIIFHSDAARKAVEVQWKVNRNNNVFIIPHGNYIGSYSNHVSQQAAREKLQISDDKLVFLFLGLIRPYKGVPALIRAFKNISQDNAYLLIAGKPLSEDLSNEIISEIGDCQKIRFRSGFVIDSQLQEFLNASDVVVFPYLRALTSGAVILAMSFGRACIAPRMGALEDTLDESGSFLYDPSDAGGLRDAMEMAVFERNRLEDMGAHNRRKAGGWTWDEVARMTADVYRRCLAGGRISPVDSEREKTPPPSMT